MPRRPPTPDEDRRTLLWCEEEACFAAGAQHVAGVDEAGRGPLAGPVVVAAVILPRGCWFPALNDSKQVRPTQRETLYGAIRAAAVAWAIEVVPVEVIDARNILQATYLGMRAALSALCPAPDIALVDGWALPDSPVPQRNLVQGDARSASIAAASILAKVHRDRLMLALDAAYPAYGFARHKGYPTAAHLAALRDHGPTPHHRRSFAPVAELLDQGILPLT